MKFCLSDLYRKVSAQIRKELRMKDAQSRLNLYKHYIPLIVSAISESIRVDSNKLASAFAELAEKHVKGEITGSAVPEGQDEITGERLEEEARDSAGTKEQDVIDSARAKGMPTQRPKKQGANSGTRRKEPASNQSTLDEVIRPAKGRKK